MHAPFSPPVAVTLPPLMVMVPPFSPEPPMLASFMLPVAYSTPISAPVDWA